MSLVRSGCSGSICWCAALFAGVWGASFGRAARRGWHFFGCTVPVVAPSSFPDTISGGFHVGCDDEVSVGLPHGVCALGKGGAGGVNEFLRLVYVRDEFVYEGQCGDCENAHQHGGHSSVLLSLWNW